LTIPDEFLIYVRVFAAFSLRLVTVEFESRLRSGSALHEGWMNFVQSHVLSRVFQLPNCSIQAARLLEITLQL
jgi:hypothetical protein